MKKICVCQLGKKCAVASVRSTKSDILEKIAEAHVAHPHPQPAQGLSEGAGEVGLAHPGGTDDKYVLVTRGEVAGKERPPDGAVKAAGRSELDVFWTGGQTELGLSKKPRKHRISPVGPPDIDRETECVRQPKT